MASQVDMANLIVLSLQFVDNLDFSQFALRIQLAYMLHSWSYDDIVCFASNYVCLH